MSSPVTPKWAHPATLRFAADVLEHEARRLRKFASECDRYECSESAAVYRERARMLEGIARNSLRNRAARQERRR